MSKLELGFEAEIHEIKAKKTCSNDKEYRIILVTSDPKAEKLIEFDTDRTYQIGVVAR